MRSSPRLSMLVLAPLLVPLLAGRVAGVRGRPRRSLRRAVRSGGDAPRRRRLHRDAPPPRAGRVNLQSADERRAPSASPAPAAALRPTRPRRARRSPALLDGSWHNAPLTLTVSATDDDGGSGVAALVIVLDGVSQTLDTPVAQVLIDAPADHHGDGPAYPRGPRRRRRRQRRSRARRHHRHRH